MDDKTFGLLEKMYSDITSRLDNIDSKVGVMNSRLEKVEGHITRLENKFDDNSKALFDGYKQHSDQLTCIEEKLIF